MRRALFVAAAVALAGCGRAAVGELRFHNRAPVWRVNDHKAIPEPKEREYNRTLYHVDGFLVKPVTRWMDFQPDRYALDVNSLDEVPDSTWFTNRIGVRDVSIEELRRGPNSQDTPFAHRPWKITSAKVGGMSIGFIFEDARGEKFLLKFDMAAFPEMETAAHVIVHRILWACGYNVPEDYIGTITRADLVIAPDATQKVRGKKVPLTAADFDRALKSVAIERDGKIRVLASKFLDGKPIGPYAREGTRADDPNDVIPHERRRSVRGQYPIFAWLNHTDLQEDNTLDAYDPKRRHVVHYLIDFGRALGVMGTINQLTTVGYTYRVDPEYAVRSLVGFGLLRQPWDDVEQPKVYGVGLFESKAYDPGLWRTNSAYTPFLRRDRFDAFWGAKLLMRFTPAQIAAVVDEAHLSEPDARAYMIRTLIERQRITARHWFNQVAPLDRFELTARGDRVDLCFDDLMLVHRLEPLAARTRYRVAVHDWDGRATGFTAVARPQANGRACVTGIVPAAGRDRYTIVRIDLSRGDRTAPPVVVHLARAPTGSMHVIGLRRR